MSYTEEEIREEWDKVQNEDDPLEELEGVLSEVYRKAEEDTRTFDAILAFMFEKEAGPYDVGTIRAYADRYQIVYEDHSELGEQEVIDLVGDVVKPFLVYMDLERLGKDMVGERSENYFEHGGRIYYFGSPV